MRRFSNAWQQDRPLGSRVRLVAALTSAVLVGVAVMAGLGHASIGSTSASATEYQYGFPTTKAQCKHGGWRNFPQFKNQGRCVSYVASGGRSASAAEYQYGNFPTTKAQCKHGGWRSFPQFKNQGRCVSYVASGGKSDHGDPQDSDHHAQHDQGENGQGQHGQGQHGQGQHH